MSARSTENTDGCRLRSSSVNRPAGARTVPATRSSAARDSLDGVERRGVLRRSGESRTRPRAFSASSAEVAARARLSTSGGSTKPMSQRV